MSVRDLPGKNPHVTDETSSRASSQPQHNMHINKALPPLKRHDFDQEGKLGMVFAIVTAVSLATVTIKAVHDMLLRDCNRHHRTHQRD